MPQPIRADSINLDLTKRLQVYTTVDASPSAASETVIATLALTSFSDIAVVSGIRLSGWAAFTCVATTTAVRLRIRQTNISGAVKADTGALTGGVSSTSLLAQDVEGFDATPAVGTYVLTLTATGAGSATTVSALVLQAIII